MDNKIEKLLYKELDGKLKESEKMKLNQAILKNPKIIKEKEKLLELRDLLGESQVSEFKPFFETRVLNKVNQSKQNDFLLSELFSDALMLQFRKFLVPAMILILVIVSYNIGTADVISFDSALGIPEVSLADAVDPINYLSVE